MHKLVVSSIAALFSVGASAGTMGEIEDNKPLLLSFGGGYSWSNTLKANPVTPLWDPAVEGYHADAGNTEFYMLGFGYRVSSAFSLAVEATKRHRYHYSKWQTITNINQVNQGNKQRNFDLSNYTVMLNGLVYLGSVNESLLWSTNNATFEPIIGAGLGIGYNEMANFHSVQTVLAASGLPAVTTLGNDASSKGFAWQLILGLHAQLMKNVSLDSGYRYVSLGKVRGPDYVNIPPINVATTVTPMVDNTLTANEFFFTVNYTVA